MFVIKLIILLTPNLICAILMGKGKSEEALIIMAAAYGAYALPVLFP